VFGHGVPFERLHVSQNLAADPTGRVAPVNLVVVAAARLSDVRLVAHAANVTPVLLIYVPFRGRPGVRGASLGQRIACKF
jgi:hypothetical protein